MREETPLLLPFNASSSRRTNSQRSRPPPSSSGGPLESHYWDWLPSGQESNNHLERSWRRRLFLLITEPETSFLSAIFYAVLILAIFASNLLMIMQTMNEWQFTPDDCRSCGGSVTYYFEDDDFVVDPKQGVPCVCPPQPMGFTIEMLDCLVCFFTVEWCLRIVLFVPSDPSPTFCGRCVQWLDYVTSPSTLVDALAIFPYYLESLPNGFVSLRLVRLFRIFQLVRLGQYNTMFLTLTNVLGKSLHYLRLLILILAFGAAFFGSMVYWLERGTWKYHEASDMYRFVRVGRDGVTEEPSPFSSIPQGFWWFMVTATTVGYGDFFPTSMGGKWVATFAMLMGVLVIAFPVSVFSDLWSHELEKVDGFETLNEIVNDDNPNTSSVGSNTGISIRQWPEDCTTSFENAKDNNAIVLDKKDLATLVECVHSIQENQQKLQGILQKYGLTEEGFRL